MRSMAETIRLLEEKKLRGRVKVLIGGAPTSPDFAREIRADAYCKDAFEAVAVANRLAKDKVNIH